MPDSGDPAVVALVQNNEIFCTGTLVSRNVILTAAHCVRYAPPDYVFFGSRLEEGGRHIGVVRVKWHPRFNGDILSNDVGLVELAEDGPATPLPMLSGPIDSSFVGREIRLVGFGAPRTGATKELEKRTGQSHLAELTATDFRFHATPTQTCLGDSGGPSFMTIDGVEVLVGTTSSGDLNCKLYGRDMRVDRYRSFIDPFIAEAAIIHYQAKGSGCSASGDTPSWNASLFLVGAAAFLRVRRRRGACDAAHLKG